MLLNNYKVYGLNIKSEIKIDEFENLNAIPEDEIVTISYSVMDDEIKKSVSEGKKIQLQKEKIWFHIDNIATYCITNKSFDEYEQTLIRDTIRARISRKMSGEQLFC